MTTATKTRRTRKTQAPKFSDRVRFNWGYHDAAADYGRGKPRTMTLSGPQNIQTVSREYDAAYFDGYRYGMSDARDGHRTESSEWAWVRSGRTDDEA